MDDKDDPYSRSYPAEPPLPPFSSLRPCSSIPDGGYGAIETDSRYGTLLSPYHQQQLYSFNPYLQGHSSHFHRQTPTVSFPLQAAAGGLQRENQTPQLSNCQPLPFHGSSTHGSHFQVKDESQFLHGLQHPPVPDMSLSLPFSAGQSTLLSSSHLPVGIQSFSGASRFRSNTDHPPQIPLSQIESLLSEAEQKSTNSDFSALPQILDNHNMNSPWQPSYNSHQAQPSEQLPSFSSFSTFYSKTSTPLTNTKNTYLTSEFSSKSDPYDNRFCIPDNGSTFTTSTTSLPGFISPHHLPREAYPRNCFLPKQANVVNSCGVPFSDFSGIEQIHNDHNQPFRMHGQAMQPHSGTEHQEASNAVADRMSARVKGGRKGRKKKQLSEESLDVEVKSLTKKKKSKTLKKSKDHPSQESFVPLPNANSDNDSVSPTFCLSPTFIASLSSKRASDPQLPSDASQTGHCATQHSSIMLQRGHLIQGALNASHKDYQVPQSHASYFGAYHNTPSVSSGNQFTKANGSQMSYTSAMLPTAKSVYQIGNSKQGSQIFNPHTNPIYTPDIQQECKPSRNMFHETQKVETEQEDKSHSPFHLSPGFIASLSSKRAEEHSVQNSLKETSSDSLKFHSNPLPGVGCGNRYLPQSQPMETSVSLSTHNTDSELPYSVSPSVRQAFQPPRIQLLDRTESYTPWNVSFQKSSLSQECNFKNAPRQAGSPKLHVSPPAYPQGSEFQYPTPPMDDDESKLQSPGLCMSPKFLDSLSNKVSSGELSHRLSPTHDDNVSVLPTPPNSAGPKQPYLPDITLSKEEQTSRILEIIAREREKVSTSPQTSSMEPKKKKKKKRFKEVGNSGDGTSLINIQLPGQTEQQVLAYCSEGSLDSDRFIGQSLQTCQKYPEMSVPSSLSNPTKSFVKLNGSSTVMPEDKEDEVSISYQYHHKSPTQQQIRWPENNCEKFDLQEDPKIRCDTSDCVRIGNMFTKNETLQKHLGNLHALEGQKHADMSQKFDLMNFNQHLYRATLAETYQDLSTLNHCPLPKHHMIQQAQSLLDKEHVKTDPYAFDDSEQVDLNISLIRSMKHAPNLPCASQTRLSDVMSTSHLPFPAQAKPLNTVPNSNVPFIVHSKPTISKPVAPSCQTLYSADSKMLYPDHLLKSEKVHTTGTSSTNVQQMSWENTSHSQSVQSDKMFFENDMPSSQLQNHKKQLGSHHKNEIVNSPTTLLTAQHCRQKQEIPIDSSFEDTHGVSFSPEGTFIKQEPQSLPHQQIIDYHKPLPDSFSSMNGHVHDVLKYEMNELAVLGAEKKKRGRPPKHMTSIISSSAKSKIPKLKLHEKKLKVQIPKKIVYKLNGTEVNSSDLNLNQNLVDRLANNLMEVADCSCLGPDHITSESIEGPYYTQLGAAKDIPGARKVLEQRTGLSGSAIRIEKVIFTGKEGKSKEGCPIAKWIIRRSGPDEKYLCIVRKRPGHFCDTAVIIIAIVAWEGVDRHQADTLYDFLISTLPQNGLETDRRCGLNEKKTCACQGVDLLRRGASFSFGCSWSMYYNGCKFARSQMARKFKLKDPDCEEELEDKLQKLASDVAPLYSQLVPDAFRNQIQFESQAQDCRLGKQPGRPFSGVTAVVDFCCHSHRDCHNMNNGSTVVVNLTKHRGFDKPDDEQYHVLPLYILDQTDELGTMEGQMAKVRNGSLEVLSSYMTQVRRRSTPYRPCQRNRTTPKKQGLKKNVRRSKLMKEKSFPPREYPDEASSKSESSSVSEDGFLLPRSPSVDKANEGRHAVNMVPGVGLEERTQESMSYTDLMSRQGTPGFGDLYAKFWDYFYTNGEFPPCEWMSKKRFSSASKAARSSFTSNTIIQPTATDQMFLYQQQQQQLWQHQEQQRRLQQLNVQVQVGQSQQQEKQRQQNLPSRLTGKQGFHSSSPTPQPPYLPASSRQQHHPHGYQCETSIPKTPETLPHLPLHTPSVTSHQGLAPQIRQPFIPKPQPTSMLLTSSKLQQQYSSDPPPPSGQSHSISTTASNHQSLESSRSSMLSLNSHSDHAQEENRIMFLHPSSQSSSPICSKSTTLASQISSVGSAEHPVKSPPPYRHSVSNQHNMQHGPQETLCSFKPQGPPPPSYCESLAQSVHDNIINLNDSQGDNYVSRFSSTQLVNGPQFSPQLHPFSQSIQYTSSGNVAKISPSAHVAEKSGFPIGVQQVSFFSKSLERPPLAQSRSRPSSAMSLPRSLSPESSERHGLELHRPPSSQTMPSSLSAHSTERFMSMQPIPGNPYTQSISCPASVQLHSGSGITQLLQKSPCALLQNGSHSAKRVNRPSSAMAAPRLATENSVPRPLSSQFLERKQLYHSVDGSQLVQEEHRPSTSHSAEVLPTPQLATTSGPCFINQQHCYQTIFQRSDSSMEKTSVEHIDYNSLNKLNSFLTKKPDDTSTFCSNNKQVHFGREGCWSRMSEPSPGADIVRPSSCSSEPGLLGGWRKDPFSLIPSDILPGKHNNETSTGPNSLYSSLDNSRMASSDNTQSSQGAEHLELKDRKFVVRQESSNMGRETVGLTQRGVLKGYGEHNLQRSNVQYAESIQNEVNYCGLFVNGPGGTVCPNGPVIGEKMKVHKSEGFVVPKLGQGPSEPPYEVIDSTVASEEIDDNRQAFNDPAMGGVAIALCHGAVMFEVAKRELHATTALKEPNRYQPKRISLVFYQHKNLNLTRHGFDEYERKIEERKSLAEQAHLIEDMEAKGFFKGELSELASFPNLTKGTFGKVFNFPESRETVFPLRFPRYLDCSHSENMTPVMFACMSIAFPNYMKEAFPNPSKLPRLMSGHMPGRMHSSLSDKRTDIKFEGSEIGNKELQFLVDSYDRCGGTLQRILSSWNPNIPQGNTMATDSVITRWVHDDVTVTGPYNRWVELALQDTIKKEDNDPSLEAESEADLKEKMFESLSQLDQEAYTTNSDMCSGSFKYTEPNMKTSEENEDHFTSTMVINLEPSVSSDLEILNCSVRSHKKRIKLKQLSVDKMEHNSTSMKTTTIKDSIEFLAAESSGPVNRMFQNSDYNNFTHQRMMNIMQPDPVDTPVMDDKGETSEKANRTAGSDTSLRNNETVPEVHKNQDTHVPRHSLLASKKTNDIDQLKALAHMDTTSLLVNSLKIAATKDENLNHTENTFICHSDARTHAPGSISVLCDPGNTTIGQNVASEFENKCEDNVGSLGAKRQESVYDFLMKGFNRPFLSSHPNGAHGIQEEFPSSAQNKCS